MIKAIESVWVRAVAVSLLLPGAAWAQTPPATTPAPAPASQSQPVVDRYIVGQAKPPDVSGSTQLDLTLEQAVQMALEKNLSLQVAKLNPQLVDYSLQSARAAFLPRYTSRYSINNSTTPSNNTTKGVENVTQNTQNFDGTFAQLLPWHGGNFSLNFTNSRQGTNDLTARV